DTTTDGPAIADAGIQQVGIRVITVGAITIVPIDAPHFSLVVEIAEGVVTKNTDQQSGMDLPVIAERDGALNTIVAQPLGIKFRKAPVAVFPSRKGRTFRV